MARRASSGVNPQALLIGAVLFILVLGGGYWFLNRSPSAFDAPVLDLQRDIDHLQSLSGNKYQITGQLIDRRIEASGSIVTLRLGENTATRHLSILVPSDFKGGNLNLQDEYTFLVQFNTKGLAVALDVKQL